MDSGAWDERYRAADRLWSVEPNVFVEDRLAGRAPGVGLDLASGEGRNAIWLAQRGWHMTAVDFSAVAVDRGRSQSDLVEFVVADVLTWVPDRSFDLVLIAYLQLPASELRPLVVRTATWLAPGGELFMVGHDRSNLENGFGGPQSPEALWDVDEILGWIEGLELVEAGVVEREVDDDGRRAVARDAVLRWRRS